MCLHAAPNYSLEERQRMKLRNEAEAIEVSLVIKRSKLLAFRVASRAPDTQICPCPQSRRWTPQQKVWRQIEVPHDMGLDCDNYKWRQNQTHVEVFVRLPEYARPEQV